MGEARYLPDFDDDDVPTLFPAHGTGVGGDLAPREDVFTQAFGTFTEPLRDPEESGLRATIRPPATSVLRLRMPPTDAATRAVLHALGERQIALASSLAWTHARVAALPRDSSTRAAAVTLLARLADLGDVRDALNELYCALARRPHALAVDPRSGHNLLSIGEPLAIHLNGIYAWVLGTAEALAILADELLRLEADWWIFRRRLVDAEAHHAEALAPAVRVTFWAMKDEAMRVDLTDALDDLSFSLRMLARNLQQRFG